MKRKIALAALLSTLAITGLAIGGDSSLTPDCFDPSWCPPGCDPCCETAGTTDAGTANACSPEAMSTCSAEAISASSVTQ